MESGTTITEYSSGKKITFTPLNSEQSKFYHQQHKIDLDNYLYVYFFPFFVCVGIIIVVVSFLVLPLSYALIVLIVCFGYIAYYRIQIYKNNRESSELREKIMKEIPHQTTYTN